MNKLVLIALLFSLSAQAQNYEIIHENLDGTKNYGFTKDGERITELVFQEVKSFKEGKAAVKQDDMWGYINSKR